jgi:hypothetical protein
VDALRTAGWNADAAYRATFALLLALQTAAVAWMFVAGRASPAATAEPAPAPRRN